MKFKRQCQLLYGLENITVVPLINVMFLLVLFIMMSSYITTSSQMPVGLPKTVTSDVIKDENITITITGENIFYFNRQVVTLKELTQKLEKFKGSNQLILVKADRQASVGRIVDIWNLCRQLGMERVNVTTIQQR